MLIDRSKVGVVFGEQDGTKYEVQYNDMTISGWSILRMYLLQAKRKQETLSII